MEPPRNSTVTVDAAVPHSAFRISGKLDRDPRRHRLNRTLHFLSDLCQPVRIDINSCPASPPAHVIAQLEAPDRLLELLPTLWALKSDHMGVGAGLLDRHRSIESAIANVDKRA